MWHVHIARQIGLLPVNCLLYTLLNCQGYINGGDGDRINAVDRNHAPTHLPKQGFFYIPQL